MANTITIRRGNSGPEYILTPCVPKTLYHEEIGKPLPSELYYTEFTFDHVEQFQFLAPYTTHLTNLVERTVHLLLTKKGNVYGIYMTGSTNYLKMFHNNKHVSMNILSGIVSSFDNVFGDYGPIMGIREVSSPGRGETGSNSHSG